MTLETSSQRVSRTERLLRRSCSRRAQWESGASVVRPGKPPARGPRFHSCSTGVRLCCTPAHALHEIHARPLARRGSTCVKRPAWEVWVAQGVGGSRVVCSGPACDKTRIRQQLHFPRFLTHEYWKCHGSWVRFTFDRVWDFPAAGRRTLTWHTEQSRCRSDVQHSDSKANDVSTKASGRLCHVSAHFEKKGV